MDKPTCGNCDLYVSRKLINSRYKDIRVCQLVDRPMNPKLKGCEYHKAVRKEGQLEKLLR